LQFSDLSTQPISLTSLVRDLGTNEIDVRHFPSPKTQPKHTRTEQEPQAAKDWGQIGQHPDKVRIFGRLPLRAVE
jgi:hypothetical protein